MNKHLELMISRCPELDACVADLEEAFQLWRGSFASGYKTLVCGNGGSAADGEHIVGELMKGFLLERPLGGAFFKQAVEAFGDHGRYLASHLQGALPTISLSSHTGLVTAFGNDVTFDTVYAQQVYGYGVPGDVLIALSTSGNSKNVINAIQVATLRGLVTIGFTGSSGGQMADLCDVTIRAPHQETYRIQECHQAMYHTLCAMLEEAFFEQT